jgi:hypothetical protein
MTSLEIFFLLSMVAVISNADRIAVCFIRFVKEKQGEGK